MPMHKQNIDAVWPLGKENFSYSSTPSIRFQEPSSIKFLK